MKECKFNDIIQGINSLDYLDGSPTEFKFSVEHEKGKISGKAIIDNKEYLRVYANGKLVWYKNPDLMELYDTIRKITLLFKCDDNTKYYIL